MRIYWNNLIENTTLTASSEDLNQNIENLKIRQLTKSFRFDGNTIESIVIAFDSVQDIKSFIIDIGNMDGLGTYLLQGNATSDFTTPSYSQSLVFAQNILYLNLDESYQYWRIVLTDTSQTRLEFGYIHIGPAYLQMPGIKPEVALNYNTTSESDESLSGESYGNEGYQYIDTQFSFLNIGQTVRPSLFGDLAGKDEILEMWNNIQNIKPVWFFLWANNLDETPAVFGKIDQQNMSFRKQKRIGVYYETSLKLKEVK